MGGLTCTLLISTRNFWKRAFVNIEIGWQVIFQPRRVVGWRETELLNTTRCYATSPFCLLAKDFSALTGSITTGLCRDSDMIKWYKSFPSR
jgi:hypothetical protein